MQCEASTHDTPASAASWFTIDNDDPVHDSARV